MFYDLVCADVENYRFFQKKTKLENGMKRKTWQKLIFYRKNILNLNECPSLRTYCSIVEKSFEKLVEWDYDSS